MLVTEEKEKRKVGERRSAQRIKRVLADTTPKHLEQLTKQARALTGDDDDDGEGELQGSSMEVMRKKLGRLQQRHFVLREKLTTANPLQKSLVTKLESEFGEGDADGILLEAEAWNDEVITDLQERLQSSGASGSGQHEEEADGQPGPNDRQGVDFTENESVTYRLPGKVIRGMKGGRICIRYDATYEDEKLESYYCVLTSSLAHDKLHVSEHSIPFFLPLRELEKAHLATSPKFFIDRVGDVLQAYISRREQVNQLQRIQGDHIGELYHSLSYSLIEIMLKEPKCQVGLSLAYYNLESELPTQSIVTAWPLSPDSVSHTGSKRAGRVPTSRSSSIRLPKAEVFLRTKPLPDACEDVLGDLRSVLGLPPALLTIEASPPTVEVPSYLTLRG